MKTRDDRKNKPGKPKSAPSKVKKNTLQVRLSDEDLLVLADKSQHVGVSYSTFLREAGLGRDLPRPIPRINIDTHQELGRIGHNLNQLVKSVHEGRLQILRSADAETVHELAAIIPVVRREVRGR